MIKRIYLIVFAMILLAHVGNSDLSKTISLELQYKSNSIWDADDDGIESDTSAIDFTVENTRFNWDVDETRLCTEWRIYSLDDDETTSLCHGGRVCCNFAALEQTNPNWNDILYLQYGKDGAAGNNKVTARVIYVDYSLNQGDSYADIQYSESDYLYAVYLDTDRIASNQIYSQLTNERISALAQSSGISNISINLTISSPAEIVLSGEDIYLNFTINITANASYLFDSGDYIPLGNNNLFSSKLNGSLLFGVIENGQHNLTIYLMDNLSDIINHSYSFTVNDTAAPAINVSIKKLNDKGDYQINIVSNEYGAVSYKLNTKEYQNNYLDENKKISVNVSLEHGKNNLTINFSDLQGNSNVSFYTYNFTPPFSCSDGIQNGDETGMDCGGDCPKCIPFNVSLEKDSFDLGEIIRVTILARADSAVNLTVLFDGDIKYNEYITSYSPDFPIYVTKPLNNINEAGAYILSATMHYMNASPENKILYFNVINRNPLTVTINANRTTINEGETIRFNAAISGNTSPVNYNWNFGDSTTSAEKNPMHTYNTNRTYTVTLTINWDEWTRTDTETITVRKLFNVTILVKNESGKAIENADVEFDSIEKNSSSDGRASFLVNPGERRLEVWKEGYNTFSNTTEITGSVTIEVKLSSNAYDISKPIIQLSGPEDDLTINQNNVVINYKVFDSSTVNCTLYINIDESWWLEKAHENNVPINSERSFTIDNLENRHYQWKIECVDKFRNSQISETRDFYVDTITAEEQMAEEQNASINQIISQIGDALSTFDYLGKEEKDAALAIDLEKQLETAKKQLQRARRDLHNLIWRRLNNTELEELRQSILDGIEDIRRTTPKTIKVIESKEIVDYPNKEDVREISLQILKSDNKKYKKRDEESYIEYNQELQNLITITTKSKIIELEYIAGGSGRITLIEKEIKSEKNLTDISLIEAIPKTIAANTSHITAFFDYSVVEEDPIIRLNMPLSKYVYYIDKEIGLDRIKEIKSVLAADDLVETSKITGFAIFGSFPKFAEMGNIRLIMEILIIIILVIIYFWFTGSLKRVKYFIKDRDVLKNVKEINQSVEKALDELQNNQYERAKSLYRNINTIFTQLPGDMKKEVYAKIDLLSTRLNVFHINKLIDKSLFSLENNQKDAAASIYKHITKIYKNISPEFKSDLLDRCSELHKKINGQKI